MIIVKDNFCEHAEGVRASALESGFGTWCPSKGEVGSSVYQGMNFKGAHGIMLRSLSAVLGTAVFPNSMFFRITTPKNERAYIHSDRADGEITCICYLSHHEVDISGTAFYRHRATDLREMPTFEDMAKEPENFDQLKKDMVSGGEEEWEQLDFVRGLFNRAVIFHAPMFHSRIPLFGLGDGDPETARMIWGCHFSRA